MKIHIWFTKF